MIDVIWFTHVVSSEIFQGSLLFDPSSVDWIVFGAHHATIAIR